MAGSPSEQIRALEKRVAKLEAMLAPKPAAISTKPIPAITKEPEPVRVAKIKAVSNE